MYYINTITDFLDIKHHLSTGIVTSTVITIIHVCSLLTWSPTLPLYTEADSLQFWFHDICTDIILL